MAIEDNPRNVEVLEEWVNKWYRLGRPAMEALAAVWEPDLDNSSPRSVSRQVTQRYSEYLDSMYLEIPA